MNKHYFLKGDISGIQSFIFNVQSKGAAKALKAKSYFVQVLGYLGSKFVLNKLPDSQLFYEGGGSFFITFECKEKEVAKKIAEIQSLLNGYQMHEELLIRLSYVAYDAANFGEAWKNLRKQSILDKQKFFDSDGSFFCPFNELKDKELKVFPELNDWLINKTGIDTEINLHKSITEILVKKESFVAKLFGEESVKKQNDFDGTLTNKLPFWRDYKHLESYISYRNNNLEYQDEGDDEGDDDEKKLKANNIIDFDGLADFAAYRTGTNKLGILKLDVDNLGKIFGSVKDEKAKEYSKILSDFFTQTVYSELYNTKYFNLNEELESYRSNIYPVFSGGDDCFFVGSWDAILCFAKDFHELFNSNSEISKIKEDSPLTFSAGIVLVDATHPVNSFSDLAENALSLAKRDGKNKISIFNLSFTWEDYKFIMKSSKELAQEMRDENISRAYLDKIRKSAKGFNALQNKDGADFNGIYKLKYYLSKNDQKLERVVELLFEPYYESLKNKLLNQTNNSGYDTAVYPSIARITELLTKTRLSYDR